MAAGDGKSLASGLLDLLLELRKYALGAVVGGLCTFLFQYKWWYEQEKLASAKDQYQKSYQTIIDFSELFHKRFYVTNLIWREYQATGTVGGDHAKQYADIMFEWNYRIDTFIKQFGVLLDQPFFWTASDYERSEPEVTYDNWKDIDCRVRFEGGNGALSRWDLIRFYPKAFDHCLSKTNDTLDGMIAGEKMFEGGRVKKERIEDFLAIVDNGYHAMTIFRQESMKRAVCNYDERTTDSLGSFIGVETKGLARDQPSCQVAESHNPAITLQSAP